MAKPTIYKTIDISSIASRSMTPLTEVEAVKTNAIVSKFFTYFKAKHS